MVPFLRIINGDCVNMDNVEAITLTQEKTNNDKDTWFVTLEMISGRTKHLFNGYDTYKEAKKDYNEVCDALTGKIRKKPGRDKSTMKFIQDSDGNLVSMDKIKKISFDKKDIGDDEEEWNIYAEMDDNTILCLDSYGDEELGRYIYDEFCQQIEENDEIAYDFIDLWNNEGRDKMEELEQEERLEEMDEEDGTRAKRESEGFYTPRRIAEKLGIDKYIIDKGIWRGKLNTYDEYGYKEVNRKEVEKYLEEA